MSPPGSIGQAAGSAVDYDEHLLCFEEAERDSQQCFEQKPVSEPTKNCGQISSAKKVGLVLSFHPILFKKNENPAAQSAFTVLEELQFDDHHLLADAKSEAVIAVMAVWLSPDGKVPGADLAPAGPGDHSNEGEIVLELTDPAVGEFRYRTQKGAKVRVKLADLVDGATSMDKASCDAVKFRASKKVGEAEIKAKIEGNCSYEFVPTFTLPKKSKKRFSLKVGSRSISNGTKGHDVMKYQWYLKRFGFLTYKERTVQPNHSQSEWTNIEDMGTDGEWGDRTSKASRDFQLVAKGAFRNQQTTKVPVTFNVAVSDSAGSEQAVECATWHDKQYTVEPVHGLAQINYTSGSTTINANAKIVYGALIENTDHRGYVEVTATMGNTRCHWGDENFEIAESIRCGIRVFRRDDLIFRLHDADPNALLDEVNLNPTLKTGVTAMLVALRREQLAEFTGATARNVRVHQGFRSAAQQDALYAKGRTIGGEPCKHAGEADRRPVGTCTVHPLGSTVTQAEGSSMSSWHQFGTAVDVVFCSSTGNFMWGDDKDWDHNGTTGKAQNLAWGGDWATQDLPHFQLPGPDSPGQLHKNTYTNANGSVAQKLQAVWALL